MARIFISYRRRDSAYVASILRDALEVRFGTDSVFFDLDDIPFGVDFRQYIGNAIKQCDVLLVMIGDAWLQLTDDHGRRRIEGLSDWVRIEIESALKREILVVPVLVEEAKMPGASELPKSIRPMAFRNSAEIRAGRDQKHQIERLVSNLERNWPAKVSDGEEKIPAAREEEKQNAEAVRSGNLTPAVVDEPVSSTAEQSRFDRDLQLVQEWHDLAGNDQRVDTVKKHVIGMTSDEFTSFMTNLKQMRENVIQQKKQHEANENKAWGEFFRGRDGVHVEPS